MRISRVHWTPVYFAILGLVPLASGCAEQPIIGPVADVTSSGDGESADSESTDGGRDSDQGDGDGDPDEDTGDGDGDPEDEGDGDGDPGDGDGDGDPGDGDGDPSESEGDGDGDGDGDPSKGDGDGDPDNQTDDYDICAAACEVMNIGQATCFEVYNIPSDCHDWCYDRFVDGDWESEQAQIFETCVVDELNSLCFATVEEHCGL